RPIRDQERTEDLPGEDGFVVGGQLGMWLRPFTFANLFFRYAQGLGVYGDLGLPGSTEPARSVASAREIVAALSLNFETRYLGVMAAAYVRGLRDPDVAPLNPRDYVEGALAVRPQIYLARWLHVALEASYQQRSHG